MRRHLKLKILLALFMFFSMAPSLHALTADEEANIRIYEGASVSVVNVITTAVGYDFFYTSVPSKGAGSGVVVDARGYIVTNYHVLGDAARVDVTLYDGSRYPASIIGADPSDDMAVLKINAPAGKLKPVEFGDSASLRVGQKVLVIGNPFGLEKTLTVGIVSSLNRTMRAENGRLIRGVIQTDAAINPGNSGGPLLDSAGKMIGVTTAIFSPVGGSVGIGFAIPVDTVKSVLPELMEKGFISRPWLGISGQNMDREAAAFLGFKSQGVLVAEVFRGGPADRAGLRGADRALNVGNLLIAGGGDFITAVDGREVRSMDDLNAIVERMKAGDTVTLGVVRDGKQMKVKVRLGEMPRNN